MCLELLPERQCATCTDTKKLEWGCETDAKQELSLGDLKITRCPRRPLLDNPEYYSYLFWLYRQMQNGILQESGGLEDQPSRMVESFRIMEVTLNECAEIKRVDEAKKTARMRRIKGRR